MADLPVAPAGRGPGRPKGSKNKRAMRPKGVGAERQNGLRLAWMKRTELEANPQNWRTHPDSQRAGLSAVMAEVGWAGALLYNERTSRLIDGHLRSELASEDALLPVLIGSWTEDQERLILLTLDPLAALAETDETRLSVALDQVKSSDESVTALLHQIAGVDPIFAEQKPMRAAAKLDQLTYRLLVQCKDETEQAALLARLEGEGLKCKVMIS
jgi:hypothetical protein